MAYSHNFLVHILDFVGLDILDLVDNFDFGILDFDSLDFVDRLNFNHLNRPLLEQQEQFVLHMGYLILKR